MQSAFTAEAGLFVTSEGGGGIEFVKGIGPDDAGIKGGGHFEDFGAFVGPDSGAEAVGGVVGFFDGFLRGAEGLDGEDGTEDFLLDDLVALGAV